MTTLNKNFISNNNLEPRGTVISVSPEASTQSLLTPTHKLPQPKINCMNNDPNQRELPNFSKLPPPPPKKK